MLKARLTVTVPSTMAEGRSAKKLWDLLAQKGRLPRIIDNVPCAGGPTWMLPWWGTLPNGVFFVSNLTEAPTGFVCQISLYPRGDADLPLGWFGWIIDNLFLSGPMGIIKKAPGDTWGYSFDLPEPEMVFTLDEIIEIELTAPD